MFQSPPTASQERRPMSPFYFSWPLGLLAFIAVTLLSALLLVGVRRLRVRRRELHMAEARREFHLRREWLEVRFLTLASSSGMPRYGQPASPGRRDHPIQGHRRRRHGGRPGSQQAASRHGRIPVRRPHLGDYGASHLQSESGRDHSTLPARVGGRRGLTMQVFIRAPWSCPAIQGLWPTNPVSLPL
jgi:hypothetical protein